MIRAFLKKKSAGFYALCAVLLINIVALVSYIMSNKASTGLVGVAYCLFILDIAAVTIPLITEKCNFVLLFVPALFALTFVITFTDNATMFMLEINGVAQNNGDMGAPNLAFWVCESATLAAIFISSVSCFLKIEKDK